VGNPEIVEAVRRRIGAGEDVPLWLMFELDARAELIAGQLNVAVLLANVSMETLINLAFRAVHSAADVRAAFERNPGPSLYQLLRRVHATARVEGNPRRSAELARKVNLYRNDLMHGNPVQLDRARVVQGVEALMDLRSLVTAGVVQYLQNRR
jgi:hypothetical protein